MPHDLNALIYCGIPGSGKSYLASLLASRVFEANDFFTDALGEYHFDPYMLGEAHGQCLRRFTAACQNQNGLVVMTGTNTTTEEIAPYYAIAEAYGYDVEVRRVRVTLGEALKHQTHDVPHIHVHEMLKRYNSAVYPNRWNVEDVWNKR